MPRMFQLKQEDILLDLLNDTLVADGMDMDLLRASESIPGRLGWTLPSTSNSSSSSNTCEVLDTYGPDMDLDYGYSKLLFHAFATNPISETPSKPLFDDVQYMDTLYPLLSTGSASASESKEEAYIPPRARGKHSSVFGDISNLSYADTRSQGNCDSVFGSVFGGGPVSGDVEAHIPSRSRGNGCSVFRNASALDDAKICPPPRSQEKQGSVFGDTHTRASNTAETYIPPRSRGRGRYGPVLRNTLNKLKITTPNQQPPQAFREERRRVTARAARAKAEALAGYLTPPQGRKKRNARKKAKSQRGKRVASKAPIIAHLQEDDTTTSSTCKRDEGLAAIPADIKSELSDFRLGNSSSPPSLLHRISSLETTDSDNRYTSSSPLRTPPLSPSSPASLLTRIGSRIDQGCCECAEFYQKYQDNVNTQNQSSSPPSLLLRISGSAVAAEEGYYGCDGPENQAFDHFCPQSRPLLKRIGMRVDDVCLDYGVDSPKKA